MTAKQFTKALTLLGITQQGFADVIKHNDRTVRSWVSGRLEVPVSIAMLLNLMSDTKSGVKDLRS